MDELSVIYLIAIVHSKINLNVVVNLSKALFAYPA